MAVTAVKVSSNGSTTPLLKASQTRRISSTLWPLICVAVCCIFATAHGQTFQYSRGWTNGKRSGPTSGAPTSLGLADLESGFVNPEISDLGFFPAHFQMNLSPQARLRTLDYNQYLARKLGVGSSGNLNTRKQPLWFGTIMGMDSTDGSSASSQTSSGGSNSNPSGTSNDFQE